MKSEAQNVTPLVLSADLTGDTDFKDGGPESSNVQITIDIVENGYIVMVTSESGDGTVHVFNLKSDAVSFISNCL